MFPGHGLPHHTDLLEKHLVKKKEEDALLLQSRSGLSLQTPGSLGCGHPSPSVLQKEGNRNLSNILENYRCGIFKRRNPRNNLSFAVQTPESSLPAQRHMKYKDPVSSCSHRCSVDPAAPAPLPDTDPGSCSSATAWFDSATLGSLEITLGLPKHR